MGQFDVARCVCLTTELVISVVCEYRTTDERRRKEDILNTKVKMVVKLCEEDDWT